MYLRTDKGYVPSEKPEGLAEDPAHFGDPQSRCVISPIFLMSCPYSDSKPRPRLLSGGASGHPRFPCSGTSSWSFRMSSDNMAPLLPPQGPFRRGQQTIWRSLPASCNAVLCGRMKA